ncbi:hypothetical protein TARUN_6560 [Trichoderma arundinaceum]|uniref:Uncharacterized protein n=1 Tax=Trichoderma arundinaceum TaxID=490622 RepID=A0A395NIJ0_TRIAR|nr:hypothetical protein TARUN_6560 [Trichoderma arundinaceum]
MPVYLIPPVGSEPDQRASLHRLRAACLANCSRARVGPCFGQTASCICSGAGRDKVPARYLQKPKRCAALLALCLAWPSVLQDRICVLDTTKVCVPPARVARRLGAAAAGARTAPKALKSSPKSPLNAPSLQRVRRCCVPVHVISAGRAAEPTAQLTTAHCSDKQALECSSSNPQMALKPHWTMKTRNTWHSCTDMYRGHCPGVNHHLEEHLSSTTKVEQATVFGAPCTTLYVRRGAFWLSDPPAAPFGDPS